MKNQLEESYKDKKMKITVKKIPPYNWFCKAVSNLKGFEGIYYDPKSFLNQAKSLIINTMKNNCNTKCKLILSCIMIRERILKKST